MPSKAARVYTGVDVPRSEPVATAAGPGLASVLGSPSPVQFRATLYERPITDLNHTHTHTHTHTHRQTHTHTHTHTLTV
jgi:hypothetical protein